MKLSGQQPDDRRGVSHVIGTVLMIAIVVVLVGAVGAYVTGFSSQINDPAPSFVATTQIDTSTTANGQYLNLTHEAGEAIDTSDLSVDVTGASYVDTTGGASGDATYTGTILEDQAGSEFIAGTTIVLDRRAFVEAGTSNDLTGTTHLDLDGATVHIFWESEGGARTTTLYSCEIQGSVCTNRE